MNPVPIIVTRQRGKWWLTLARPWVRRPGPIRDAVNVLLFGIEIRGETLRQARAIRHLRRAQRALPWFDAESAKAIDVLIAHLEKKMKYHALLFHHAVKASRVRNDKVMP